MSDVEHEKGEKKDEKDDEHSTGHIIQSLAVNVLIAVTKAIAAFFTKSGAMLAEALHSFSDCGNQILLLIGVRQARKPPDASHPLGYGRALYFWSFLVALMLFAGGGVFSVYEGVHKVREPEPVEKVWLGLLILFISIALEGGATISNIRELNKRRGKTPFFQYLGETKDSDLIVVFGENSAAVLGLMFAILALVLAWKTNDGRWDGIGSILIGAVLIGVAIFLARKVQSLLLGEAAAFSPKMTMRSESFVLLRNSKKGTLPRRLLSSRMFDSVDHPSSASEKARIATPTHTFSTGSGCISLWMPS